MIYKIVRHNKSGGSINIGLNGYGQPVYTAKNKDALFFVKEQDATYYLNYCKAHMKKYMGQTDFSVVGFKEE